MGFVEGAKQTWDLLTSSGVLALINDDLSAKAMFMGNLIAFLLCGGISFAISYSYYWDMDSVEDDVSSTFVAWLTLSGAIAGFCMCSMVLQVVRSAIITMFVCYAEEPAILGQNHPNDWNKIKDVKPDFEMETSVESPEFDTQA